MIASVEALKVLQHLGGDNPDALNRLKLVMDKVQEHNRLEDHKGAVTSVSFNHTQKTIATASEDKTIKIWDINGKLKSTIIGHSDIISKVKFSPDEKVIAS
ncbi:MAG: WD40 repeat domain-containing protein, partial [Nostoc sp.]